MALGGKLWTKNKRKIGGLGFLNKSNIIVKNIFTPIINNGRIRSFRYIRKAI
jgi:hypothetical protein